MVTVQPAEDSLTLPRLTVTPDLSITPARKRGTAPMFDTTAEAAALGTYVAQHQGTITNALRVFARDMQEASDRAQAAYEAGRANPAVRAQQDDSIMTNAGSKHSATMFAAEARKANAAAAEIDRLIDGDEVEGDYPKAEQTAAEYIPSDG